jgi:hypothetical protein
MQHEDQGGIFSRRWEDRLPLADIYHGYNGQTRRLPRGILPTAQYVEPAMYHSAQLIAAKKNFATLPGEAT